MAKYWKYTPRIMMLGGAAATAIAGYKYLAPKNDDILQQSGNSKPSDKPNLNGKLRNSIATVHASWTTGYKPSVSWDHDWDKRAPESLIKPSKKRTTDQNNNEINNELEKSIPTATRHIILIRHGQYNSAEEYDENQTLTALGREQANETGVRLKKLSIPLTILIHSTMQRATETANIIANHLPEVPRESCELLREGAPIPPEPEVGHWKPLRHFYEDGARIEAAFRHYFYRASPDQKRDSYELMVCHANVIRYFVCRALQFPPEAWLRMSLHHASITWVTIRPNGRVSLHCLGDSGHLPPNYLTFR